MKPTASLICIYILCAGTFAQTADPGRPQGEQQHTAWIVDVLRRIETLKVGMTRSDLEKTFTTEGGISTATTGTYVLRECRFIKIDVKFQAAKLLEERPTDKIVEISRPYLAWAVMD